MFLFSVISRVSSVVFDSGSFASLLCVFFFLMIRRPQRSTLDRSSAASDVYKGQDLDRAGAQSPVRVMVGLYDPVTGVRLPVSATSLPSADNAVEVRSYP